MVSYADSFYRFVLQIRFTASRRKNWVDGGKNKVDAIKRNQHHLISSDQRIQSTHPINASNQRIRSTDAGTLKQSTTQSGSFAILASDRPVAPVQATLSNLVSSCGLRQLPPPKLTGSAPHPTRAIALGDRHHGSPQQSSEFFEIGIFPAKMGFLRVQDTVLPSRDFP
jgi:hypothetical protein